MMAQTTTNKPKVPSHSIEKIRSYSEVVSFLDKLKPIEYSSNVPQRMKDLNTLLGNVTDKVDIALIGGTNGKSSSMHFAAKLLNEEGFKVGISYSTHFPSYNERTVLNAQQITNKTFTDIANKVINTVESNNIKATSFEITTMISLLLFAESNIDIALLEVGLGGKYDATTICNPLIAAVTRIAEDHTDCLSENLDEVTFEMLEIAKSGTWLVSAEQSKIRLQKMKNWAEAHNVKWAMPIRKLASLPYVYEQLYGRSASLGERIAQIYTETIKGQFSPFLRGNLLATEKGQRGRPTLQAKRDAELNPIKTLKTFWAAEFNLLRGRFELLNKEKPSILIDGAHNVDALSNVFLGVRLLHYQKPLNGLSLIIGLQSNIKANEVLKLVRYLLKKVTGNIYFVPLSEETPYHTPEDLASLSKELNISAHACKTFDEAFNKAKSTVDERDGLIVITGTKSMVTNYWNNRGIKKF